MHCIILWNNSQHMILILMFLMETHWIFIISRAHFHEPVEKRINDPRGRLIIVLKHTSIDGKEMIKHCVHELPTMNYHHIIVEYRKKAKVWPIIRNGNTEGYQRFCNFLLKCGSITQSAHWNQLGTPDVICMLLAKLSDHTRDKWAIDVLRIRRRQLREPDLLHFIKLLEDETLLIKNPLFSKSVIYQYFERSSKGPQQNPSTKQVNKTS